MGSFKATPGLYLHIPFCRSFCPFCPYNKVLYEPGLVRDYFKALSREVGWYQAHLRKPFASLYIGGGTPTLCLEELESIVKAIPVDGEKAIEMLPSDATEGNIQQLEGLGINFLSLGIQSFDQSVLHYLKRPHTVADNHQALQRVAGSFECVDVDLIFDVAYEEKATFLQDLETCFKAGVEQVSSYPLMRFGYTPFGKSKHLPRKEHQVLQEAAELADRFGYERRSVWTFNRKDAANYTSITREFYLGCGAGAGSYTGTSFFLNHFSPAVFIEKVNDGQLPIARFNPMSATRSAAYYLFWQAYTGRIDLPRFHELFPGRWGLKRCLDLLRFAGLLHSRGNELLLTRRGYAHYHDLERWVTYHFIEPLWNDMMQEHEFLREELPKLSFSQRFWLHFAGMAG
jgi:oxygen-independent coproporphyrinogen-3 oxidase